jgi:hypothetical protein
MNTEAAPSSRAAVNATFALNSAKCFFRTCLGWVAVCPVSIHFLSRGSIPFAILPRSSLDLGSGGQEFESLPARQ